MEKLLATLSLFIPQSLLSSRYIQRRLELFADDSTDCEHEWYVVAGILSTGSLQVQCVRCASFSEVDNPSLDEWERCAGAMENPYPWEDAERVNPIRD